MTISLSNQTISDGGPNPPRTSGTAGYALLSSGDIQKTVNTTNTDIGDWISPKSGMSGYEAQFAPTSGTLSGGTANTWLDLASNESWFVQVSGTGFKSCTGTVSIRDKATQTVQGSCTVTLTVSISH